MKLPNKLIITNGKITLEDGSDATNYLYKWQSENKISNGVAINAITRADLAQIYNELWEQRNLAQAA